MNKIYCENGVIDISYDGKKYIFYNPNTSMRLYLHKGDINNFMLFDYMDNGYSTLRSKSNYMSKSEIESIQIYLKIKNKRLKKISSILNSCENIKNVLKIIDNKELYQYAEKEKLWKNL